MHRSSFSIFAVFAATLLMGAGCFSFGANTASTNGPAGVFVSTDRGENWQNISLLPQAQGVSELTDTSVYRLVQDPLDPDSMYWASRTKGMFFTYDKGRTWQRPNDVVNSGPVYDVEIDPTDKCRLFVARANTLYRSTDCSRTFEESFKLNGGDRIESVAIDPTNPLVVWQVTRGGEIFKSIDGGVSWQIVRRLGTNVRDIFVDPYNTNIIYVPTQTQGLARSSDGGNTWIQLDEPLREYPEALQLRRFYMYPSREGVMYWVADYGILKSEDRGETWTPFELTNPPGSAKIYALAVNPQNENELYYTATIGSRSTFYKSVDGGVNWITRRLPSGQVPTYLLVHPEDEQIIYLGYTIPSN